MTTPASGLRPGAGAFSPESIRIILGIGNPDEEYGGTYHNVGKQALDELAAASGSSPSFQAPSRKHFAFAQIGGRIYAKSLTYMNESGLAAREALDYFKLTPGELLVAHDDSDMTLGSYKFSFDQRSAGHRGIDSIIGSLGTQEFYHLKIGIRPAAEEVRQKALDFVLKKISKADQEILAAVWERIRPVFRHSE
jgi:PTH1 family peptidyl-tRNA hydrolase